MKFWKRGPHLAIWWFGWVGIAGIFPPDLPSVINNPLHTGGMSDVQINNTMTQITLLGTNISLGLKGTLESMMIFRTYQGWDMDSFPGCFNRDFR